MCYRWVSIGKNHNLFYVQTDTTYIFLLLEDLGKEAPSAQDQVIDAVDSWNTGQSRIEMASDLLSHINISSDTVALLDPETVLTTTCIFLSAATNVVSFKFPDVTMYKIQESLKRIEDNIDKILAAPLKIATDFFGTIGNDILTGNYEDAFDCIQRLDSEATKAFYYADGPDISIKSFKECAKAARLKMFAAILKGSYDRQEKVFVPSHKLPPQPT